MHNNSSISLYGQQHRENIHREAFPTAEEELVVWAKQRFGGVTSFTTIRNPLMVNWTRSRGET